MHRRTLLLLLLTCLGQAWAEEGAIDTGRLQQQIEQHAERASQTMPAPAGGESSWMHEQGPKTPYPPGRVHRPHPSADGPSPRQEGPGGGYGRGYEMRYGPMGGTGGHGGRR